MQKKSETEATDEAVSIIPGPEDDGIETTEEEIDGFLIGKAILRRKFLQKEFLPGTPNLIL